MTETGESLATEIIHRLKRKKTAYQKVLFLSLIVNLILAAVMILSKTMLEK